MAGPIKSSIASPPRPAPSIPVSGAPRSLEQLAAQVSAVREANTALVREIETLRGRLATSNERQLTLEHRVARLEKALSQLERDTGEQRQRLIEHQDEFIAGLMADHEREVDELNKRLGRASNQRLQQSLADQDVSDLEDALSRPTRPAPAPEENAAKLDALALRQNPTLPMGLPIEDGSIAPDGRIALPPPAPGKEVVAPSAPPLRRKPDAASRPLIGYSMAGDEVEEERLEGVRLSRPPGR